MDDVFTNHNKFRGWTCARKKGRSSMPWQVWMPNGQYAGCFSSLAKAREFMYRMEEQRHEKPT